MVYSVTYTNWQGYRREVCVTVHEASFADASRREYYATARELGCGKNSTDPEGAIKRLVMDHGTYLTCSRGEPQ